MDIAGRQIISELSAFVHTCKSSVIRCDPYVVICILAEPSHNPSRHITVIVIDRISVELAAEGRYVIDSAIICSGPYTAFAVLHYRIHEPGGDISACLSLVKEVKALRLHIVKEKSVVRADKDLTRLQLHEGVDMGDS